MLVEFRDDEKIVKTLSVSPGSIWISTRHVAVGDKIFTYDSRLSISSQNVIFSHYTGTNIIRAASFDELNSIL